VTEKSFSNLKLLVLVTSTLLSSPSLSNDDAGECRKYLDSDPVKRFFQETFDRDGGIDGSCYRIAEKKKLLKASDNDYFAEEVTDAQFRARSQRLVTQDVLDLKPNRAGNSRYITKSSQQTEEDKDTPLIQTVEGFISVK
jgi:hypothetical protein